MPNQELKLTDISINSSKPLVVTDSVDSRVVSERFLRDTVGYTLNAFFDGRGEHGNLQNLDQVNIKITAREGEHVYTDCLDMYKTEDGVHALEQTHVSVKAATVGAGRKLYDQLSRNLHEDLVDVSAIAQNFGKKA